MELIINSTVHGSHVVYFDDIDAEIISQYHWILVKVGKTFYARTEIWKNGNVSFVKMHRLIMNAKGGILVDHINKNGLDNRRNNLRCSTNSQNLMNRGKNKNNKSGYKGVSWSKSSKKWVVQIMSNGIGIIGGYFDSKIEAALCYNKLAVHHHGEFARLNTIDDKIEQIG